MTHETPEDFGFIKSNAITYRCIFDVCLINGFNNLSYYRRSMHVGHEYLIDKHDFQPHDANTIRSLLRCDDSLKGLSWIVGGIVINKKPYILITLSEKE